MAFRRSRVRAPPAPLIHPNLVVPRPADALFLPVLRRGDPQVAARGGRDLSADKRALLHLRAVHPEQVHLAGVALADTTALLAPRVDAARVEVDGAVRQLPHLALDAEEAPALLDDQVVPLEVAQGQQHGLALERQRG